MPACRPDRIDSSPRYATRLLAALGLWLSEAKTQIVQMREGFDFLGFHIRRSSRQDLAGVPNHALLVEFSLLWSRMCDFYRIPTKLRPRSTEVTTCAASPVGWTSPGI
jgi:hypothetical protein